jgi:hypothetical protein
MSRQGPVDYLPDMSEQDVAKALKEAEWKDATPAVAATGCKVKARITTIGKDIYIALANETTDFYFKRTGDKEGYVLMTPSGQEVDSKGKITPKIKRILNNVTEAYSLPEFLERLKKSNEVKVPVHKTVSYMYD